MILVGIGSGDENGVLRTPYLASMYLLPIPTIDSHGTTKKLGCWSAWHHQLLSTCVRIFLINRLFGSSSHIDAVVRVVRAPSVLSFFPTRFVRLIKKRQPLSTWHPVIMDSVCIVTCPGAEHD